MRARLFLVAAALLLGACSPPPSKEAVVETYPLAGPVIHVMILDQTKLGSPEDLPRLAQDFCSDRDVKGCFVWMYFDRSVAPLEHQGGNTAKADPIFSYTSNWATDLEQNLWNCDLYPRPSDSECLALTRNH